MNQVTERLSQGSSYAGIGMLLLPIIDAMPISPEWKETAKASVLGIGGIVAVLVNR